MAHNIFLKSTGKTESEIMAEDYALYLYEKAGWHGLGTVSKEKKNRHEIAEICAMDFEAQKVEMFAGASFLPVPDKFAVVNPNRGDVLGVVGNDYTITQWSEIFDFVESFRDFMPEGLTYESAGLLGNGAKGFVQIRLGEAFKFGTDEIAPFLYVFNSMDGTKSITIAPTTTRIVCQNTLEMAFRDSKGRFRAAAHSIRHTSNSAERLEIARQEIRQASAVWATMKEDLKRMSDTKAPENFIDKLINDVFGEIEKDAKQNTKTRRENVINRVNEIFNSRTSKGTSQDSVFSYYSALNEYMQYDSTVHGTGTIQTFARLESDMLGKIRADKLSAYEAALNYI